MLRCFLLAGLAFALAIGFGSKQYRIGEIGYSEILFDEYYSPICSITWSDLIKPCSVPIALIGSRFGLSRRAEENYILFPAYAGLYAELAQKKRNRAQCVSRRVEHIGNANTTRFIDGHDYFRPLRMSQASDELWQTAKLGESVEVCSQIDADKHILFAHIASGNVDIVKLW